MVPQLQQVMHEWLSTIKKTYLHTPAGLKYQRHHLHKRGPDVSSFYCFSVMKLRAERTALSHQLPR